MSTGLASVNTDPNFVRKFDLARPGVKSGHGTYSMYARRGCRCDECKEYQRARVAKNRAERLATGNLTHGTRSAYDAGCRCAFCKKSRSIAAAGERHTIHNHITRDIKPYGMCPACDEYHVGGKR